MKWINFRDVDMPYPRTFVVDLGSGNVIKVPNLDSAIIKGLTRFFHGKPLVVEEYQRQKNGSHNRVKVHTFKTPDELPPKIRERYLKIRNKVNEDVYASSASERPEVTSKWSLIARGPSKNGVPGRTVWRNNETGGISKKKDGWIFDARLNNYDLERLERIKEADKKKQKEYIAPKYPYTKKKGAGTSLLRGLSSNLQNSTFRNGYGGTGVLSKEDPYDKTLRSRREAEVKQERETQRRWEMQQGIIDRPEKFKSAKDALSMQQMKVELQRRFNIDTGNNGALKAMKVYNSYINRGMSKEAAFQKMSRDIYYGQLKGLKEIKDHAIRDFAVLGVVTALIPFVKSAMLSQVGGFIASKLFNKLLMVSMKPGTLTDNIVKEIKRDGNDLVRALKRNGNAAYRQIEMLINKI